MNSKRTKFEKMFDKVPEWVLVIVTIVLYTMIVVIVPDGIPDQTEEEYIESIGGYVDETNQHDDVEDVDSKSIETNSLDAVIDAIQQVENPNRDPEAIGDQHLVNKAYGLYQIRKPYLDDVNRIAGVDLINTMWGKDSLTLEDMKDEAKARWATSVYLKHYGDRYASITGMPANNEVYARIHNGGPNGWKKASTNAYFNKIIAIL